MAAAAITPQAPQFFAPPLAHSPTLDLARSLHTGLWDLCLLLSCRKPRTMSRPYTNRKPPHGHICFLLDLDSYPLCGDETSVPPLSFRGRNTNVKLFLCFHPPPRPPDYSSFLVRYRNPLNSSTPAVCSHFPPPPQIPRPYRNNSETAFYRIPSSTSARYLCALAILFRWREWSVRQFSHMPPPLVHCRDLYRFTLRSC